MAPLMSLCRASCRPGQSLLAGSSNRSSSQQRQPRSVAAHAASDDNKCNAAIATLSAASLLVSSGAVDPAVAADLAPASAGPSVVAASQLSTPASKFAPGVAAPVLGEVADLNADVRGQSSDYKDPTIAAMQNQDFFSDAMKNSSNGVPSSQASTSPDTTAADVGKEKVKAALGISALPATPLGEVADLNADVRDLAKDYRDPAGAIQQDKFKDAVSSGGSSLSSPDLSSAGDKLSDAAESAKAKASNMFSAATSSPQADVGDLNKDVRGAAKGYRDPAGAIQQDKAAGAVSGSSGMSMPNIDTPSKSDITSAAESAKSKAKSLFGSGTSSALPVAPMGDLADQNADVRGLSAGYRDPAGAIQQDKAANAVKSSSSGPNVDLPSKSDITSAAESAKSKTKSLFGSGTSSALPVAPMGDLADQNADVRGLSAGYRDPAGAIQQDKAASAVKSSSSGPNVDLPSKSDITSAADSAKSKAKSLFGSGTSSALPVAPMGDLADQNADVRGLSAGYRDPAGAIQQDKAADAVSGSSSTSMPNVDLPNKSDITSAAESAKSKAKSLFGSGTSSALPGAPMGDLADQNADVRGLASGYRDPVGSIKQDTAADAVSAAKSTPGSVGDKASSAADTIKQSVKDITGSGISMSTMPVLGDLADQNADVRGLSAGYRDPAGAIQQDKAASAVSGSSGMSMPNIDTPSKSDITSAAESAKSKAKSLFGSGTSSALPVAPMGDLADQNADVRGLSAGYRDPAGAIQQDKAASAVKSSSSGPNVDLPSKSDITSAAESAKSKAESILGSGTSSALPVAPMSDVGDLNKDVRGAAKGYRDPAGAIQQDKAAGAVKDATKGSGSSIGSGKQLKAKAKSLFGSGTSSALPVTPLGEVADLNRDVRGESEDYRDPAGAIQQDKAAGAVKDATKSGPSLSKVTGAVKDATKSGPSLSKVTGAVKDATKSGPSLSKVTDAVQDATKSGPSLSKVAKKVKPQISVKSSGKSDIGSGASYGASKGTSINDAAGIKRLADDVMGTKAKPVGNARLSKPLVRDSLGRLRTGSKNQTGAAGGSDRGALDLVNETADRI